MEIDAEWIKEQAQTRLDEIIGSIHLPMIRRNTRVRTNLLWLMRNIGFSDELSDEQKDEVRRLLRILVKD